MSLIIENGKVIRANGTMDQIIDDFNEYLEFIRETTIPVPKEQFNNLSENRNKLYGDYMTPPPTEKRISHLQQRKIDEQW